MLYSQPLGLFDAVDNGVLHNLYTVPVGGGPAILRSVSLRCNAGGLAIITVTDGTHTAAVAFVDATAAPNLELVTVELYQPLPIGWSILGEQITGAPVYWGVACGGYQFSTP